jgi:post-segregation antitoxin (ccd killing protein)
MNSVEIEEKKTKKEIKQDELNVAIAEKGGALNKEEGIEVSTQKAETGIEKEKNPKIEKLWQEVEKNRKDYLEKDYKNNKVAARLKKFFGSFLKKDKEDAWFESDKELAECRAYYDNALLEHKKAVIEDAKFKGVTGKELLEIAKLYQVEANVNLADVHDQVKIENQDGKISGFIKEHSKVLIEKYKKMPLAQKIAIGTAFGLAGVGAAAIGGGIAILAATTITGRRIFIGVVTGTSVSLGFEALGKKRTKEKIEKEMEILEKKIDERSEEEKIKMIEEFVNKDIQDKDQKINKIKNKNLRHLAYGIAAGAVGSGIWSYFVEDVFGDAPKGGGKNVPMSESSDIKADAANTPEQDIPEGIKSTVETPQAGSSIVEVQKGDSLWKIIDKRLEDYDGYEDLNPAQKTYVIDALKDQIAEDPEKFGLDDIDKLKIGQKINLSAIFDGEDSEVGDFMEKAQGLSEDQTESILENNQKLRDGIDGEVEENPKSSEVEKASEAPEKLKIEDTQNVDNQTKGSDEVKEPRVEFRGAKVELSEEARGMIEKSADNFGKKIVGINMLEGGEYWSNIKDLKYFDIQGNESLVKPYTKSRLDGIVGLFKEKFGPEGVPKSNEKIKDWLARLVEKHGESKIPNFDSILKKHTSSDLPF